MRKSDAHEYAWQLMQSFGEKAEVEASRREREAQTAGRADEVENWERIRAAIREHRGAHES